MKISVCMIVLNEEKVIKRALTCANNFADEIILVDTGSSDKTVEIAKEFTSKIYHFKWVNDFSKARNFAFENASCDYLFWLDADDYITKENVDKILKIKRDKTPKDTYMFKYSCGFNENNEPSLTFYRERLVKNCKIARFVGFVHEVIIPFGQIEYTDVEIEHRKVEFTNSKRNLNLYKSRLPLTNFSPRDVYYFAKEYYYLGYYKSAIKLLKKYLKMQNLYLPDKKDALLTLSYCYKFLNYEKCEKFLFEAIKSVGLDGEVLSRIGDYFLEKKDYVNAEKFYRCALTMKKSDCIGFCNNEFYYLYPLLQLTYLNYEKGDIELSFYYHEKCMNGYSYDKRVAHNQEFFNKINKF